MTQHAHSEFIEGCYRCDLSRDEIHTTIVVSAEEFERLSNDDDQPTPGLRALVARVKAAR